MREGRRRTQAVFLALCDALMVLLAMQIAWWLRFDVNNWLASHFVFDSSWWPLFRTGWTPAQPYLLAIFVALPIFWLILREMNLYAEPEDSEGEFFRLCAAALVASVLLAALGFYFRTQHEQQQFLFSRGYCVLFLPASALCLRAGRGVCRFLLRLLARRGLGQHRLLFVGCGPLADELARAFAGRGTNVVVGALQEVAVVERPGEHGQDTLKILGSISALASVVETYSCDEVIVALPEAPQTLLKQLAEDCYRAHVRFRIVPDVYEMLLDHMDLSLINGIPLLGMRGSRIEGVNFLVKRLFDIGVSTVLLLLLAPVFLLVALLIKLTSAGPVFYYQERLGYRRRKFRLCKFRSMRAGSDKGTAVCAHQDYLKDYIAGVASGGKDEAGRAVFKITRDPRITPAGRFLRRYSLDELPQLWNVLKGDMSLIGPRPPIAYEVDNYRPIHLRRFEARPGISGLWQVSGRNMLTFDEMVKLDLYYIENWSLELDLRILFKTISVVLFERSH